MVAHSCCRKFIYLVMSSLLLFDFNYNCILKGKHVIILGPHNVCLYNIPFVFLYMGKQTMKWNNIAIICVPTTVGLLLVVVL